MLIDSQRETTPGGPSSPSDSQEPQSPPDEPGQRIDSTSDEESMGGRGNDEVGDDIASPSHDESSEGNEEAREHVISLSHDESLAGTDIEEPTQFESMNSIDEDESREVQDTEDDNDSTLSPNVGQHVINDEEIQGKEPNRGSQHHI